jgi:uncharacterized heparinase superfamily protein
VVGGFSLNEDNKKRIHLPQAGYFGLRDEDEYVLIDCGKVSPDHLPAHGHGDIFSFEWTISGQRLIVDAGVYEYNPGWRRKYSRSTRAHNTVTVDDHDQCEFWGAFRMGRRARVTKSRYQETDSGFILEGEHDGYRCLSGQPIHHRRFDVANRQIKVEDRVEQGDGQKVSARLLLHPRCSIRENNDNFILGLEGEGAILITSGDTKIRKSYWYPNFGKEVECKQVSIVYGNSPCKGEFLLKMI